MSGISGHCPEQRAPFFTHNRIFESKLKTCNWLVTRQFRNPETHMRCACWCQHFSNQPGCWHQQLDSFEKESLFFVYFYARPRKGVTLSLRILLISYILALKVSASILHFEIDIMVLYIPSTVVDRFIDQ